MLDLKKASGDSGRWSEAAFEETTAAEVWQ